MTDKFCYALLRTTALQILQSAGFDAAHTDPTNSLTEVMSQYLQLLATTTSSYAELAGRSNGNIWDVVDGLNELGITPESLKEWLDLEGKTLSPTWTAQSDPGRTLEGMVSYFLIITFFFLFLLVYSNQNVNFLLLIFKNININNFAGAVKNGRNNYDDALVYEYKDIPSDIDEQEGEGEVGEEIYSLESDEEQLEEKEKGEESIPKDDNKKEEHGEENNGLPDYIPPYMPRFPSSIKEDATPPPRALPQVMPSITQQSSSGTAVPAPIIVRHRKKPVDNPFTHVVPFEESVLATDKATTLALSLNENEENDKKQQLLQQQQPATKRRRVALSSLPMKKAMTSLASNNDQRQRRRQGDALAGNHEMFRKFTQDEAAPGNTMFGSTNGVLEELLRRVAPPAMVSKLSSPNLLVDVATVPAPATPANPISNGTSLNQQESVTIKTSTTASNNNNNNNNGGTGASNSTSMLASLAGGQYSRKHSLEENVITPGLNQSTSSSSIENQSSLSAPSTQPVSTTVTIPTTITAAATNSTSTAASSSTASSPSQRPNLTPISLASLSAGPNTGGSGKAKSGSGKSSSKSSSGKGTGEKKKLPKLTLNLTNGSSSGGANEAVAAPSTAENTPSSATSLNTPKIRFKIKPPEPANDKIDITSTDDSPPPSSSSAPAPQPEPSQKHTPLPVSTPPQQRQQSPVGATATTVNHPPVAPPLEGDEVQEIVQCICANPTVDYGTFMISCDKCHVWYHGECVGIAEKDNIETWYCKNCKA